ncbi:hypothetical protein [Zoogloea sp.]|uniref:hypothetical protein n=1 Tax=Zoogloea sp. TaxID=49181 RepID=UPI0035B272C6
MLRHALSLLTILFTIFLTGCGMLPRMPLSEDSAKLDTSKPLYLMSVVVKNEYKQRYQPNIVTVILAKDSGSTKPEQRAFRMDDKGTITIETDDEEATTFLVRFSTEPIPHSVLGFRSTARAFPLTAFYFVPLHADIPKADNGVHYLGSVKAVIRERQDGEFRAGPPAPLIDQAVGGASSGTFDIEIADAYDSDIALFKKTFPALRGIEISRAILGPWDRARAQLYWEQN